MNLIYDIFMAPFETFRLKKMRKALLTEVSGDVLEIGTGTGANLPFLPYRQMTSLTLSDLKLSKRVMRYRFPVGVKVNRIESPLEDLNFDEGSFDSVVFTLVFCSVEDPLEGLRRVRQLLKPGGKIYFIEHVLPDHHRVRAIAHKLNPGWNEFSKGCNLNRETLDTIREAGFRIERYSVSLGGALLEGIGIK